MKKLFTLPFFLAILLVLSTGSPAKTQHWVDKAVLTLDEQGTAALGDTLPRYQDSKEFVSNIYEVEPFELLSLNWVEEIPEQTAASMQIRFRTLNGHWTDWQALHEDEDTPDTAEDGLWSYVVTERSDAFQYRATLSTNDESKTPKLANFQFDAVSGGRPAPIAFLGRLVFRDQDQDLLTRRDWGADENLRLARNFNRPDSEDIAVDEADDGLAEDPDLRIVRTVENNENGEPYWWPMEYPANVKKIVVHHTATTENLSNPEAAIRAIYQYHTKTRAWGDIGYNFIIAPDGSVYEGRAGGAGVVGAHAAGFNTGSVGIALLGNYSEANIPGPMMQSLMDLIYEQAEEHSIDVDGSGKFRGLVLKNLLMHRELSATACPGTQTVSLMGDLTRVIGNSMDTRRNSNFDDAYSYEEISSRDLILLDRNSSKGEVIRLKNNGTATWNSSTKLVAKNLNNSSGVASLTVAKMKESSVAHGQTATFTLSLKSNSSGGLAHYELTPQWSDGKKSLHVMDVAAYVYAPMVNISPTGTPTPTSNTSSAVKAEFVAASSDLNFEAGASKYVWIQLKNTGSTTWTSDKFKLKISGLSGASVGQPRLSLRSAAPGTSPKVFFTLTAPLTQGGGTVQVTPEFDGKTLLTTPVRLNLNVQGSLPSVEIPNAEQAIRIKLNTDQTAGPLMSAPNNFSVYNDQSFLKTYSKGTLVRVRPEGSNFLITSGSDRWTVAGPVRFLSESGGTVQITSMERRPAWDPTLNDNTFRGTVEIRNVDGKLTLINELPLEDYLKGVAEIANDTHPEKAKAMSILARTYALFYMTQAEKFPGKPYHLDDSPDVSQKYLGYGFEKRSSQIKTAVESTASQVVTYNGKLVKTPYFSQSDGIRTKSAFEVWGWTDTPYLQSVPDTQCQGDVFYGHGVGLSGCGAEALADQGKTYLEIIKTYFTGVQVVKYTGQ